MEASELPHRSAASLSSMGVRRRVSSSTFLPQSSTPTMSPDSFSEGNGVSFWADPMLQRPFPQGQNRSTTFFPRSYSSPFAHQLPIHRRSVNTRTTKDIFASEETCPRPLHRTDHHSEPVLGTSHEVLGAEIGRIRSNPYNPPHHVQRSDLDQSPGNSKLFPIHQDEIPLLEATSTTQRDSSSVKEGKAPIASHTEQQVTSCTNEAAPEIYGWGTAHIVREPQDEDLLEVCTTLGQGSLGIVEEVRRKGTRLPTFVRKRFIVPFWRRNIILRVIQEEAQNLKSLSHPHVLTFVGSYEERKQNRHFYCLLMSPVGDNDLREFLEIYNDYETPSQTKIEWEKWLRGWFVCLASALAYMHERGVRHQDIKPSNIIHRGNRILFTDFSSSAAFEVGHTTSTDDPSRSSPMYAAPEITRRSYHTTGMIRHGRSADVFALGCVFSDMLNTWQGYSTSSFHHYLASGGNTSNESSNSGKLRPVVYNESISLISKRFHNSTLFHQCILPMLALERVARPTAATTLRKTLSLHPWADFECYCIGTKASVVLDQMRGASHAPPGSAPRKTAVRRKSGVQGLDDKITGSSTNRETGLEHVYINGDTQDMSEVTRNTCAAISTDQVLEGDVAGLRAKAPLQVAYGTDHAVKGHRCSTRIEGENCEQCSSLCLDIFPPLHVIREHKDGVDCCPICTWQLIDGYCQQCGFVFDESGEVTWGDSFTGFSISDEASERDTADLDSQLDVDEIWDDYLIRGFLEEGMSHEFSQRQHISHIEAGSQRSITTDPSPEL